MKDRFKKLFFKWIPSILRKRYLYILNGRFRILGGQVKSLDTGFLLINSKSKVNICHGVAKRPLIYNWINNYIHEYKGFDFSYDLKSFFVKKEIGDFKFFFIKIFEYKESISEFLTMPEIKDFLYFDIMKSKDFGFVFIKNNLDDFSFYDPNEEFELNDSLKDENVLENELNDGFLYTANFFSCKDLLRINIEVSDNFSAVFWYRENEFEKFKDNNLFISRKSNDISNKDLTYIIGESEAIQQLKSDLRKVAPLHVPVLLIGESGTGKELAAKAIHSLSKNSENPMVIVNAAAIPGNLVEAELFGYESGSFTGAEKGGRKGKFEIANNSSIFFDEVGDLPSEVQVKLLRVLQDGFFEKVGGNKSIHSEFRLISASNRNFEEMVNNSEFRLDLYYRISGVSIRMPSLRERLDDLSLLMKSFLKEFCFKSKLNIIDVDENVYGYLSEFSWPGNVRQLRHEVEKAAIFCNSNKITIEDFRMLGGSFNIAPKQKIEYIQPNNDNRTEFSDKKIIESKKIQDAVEVLEKNMISAAMIKYAGNKKKVAEELGISRAYLYKKLSINE